MKEPAKNVWNVCLKHSQSREFEGILLEHGELLLPGNPLSKEELALSRTWDVAGHHYRWADHLRNAKAAAEIARSQTAS